MTHIPGGFMSLLLTVMLVVSGVIFWFLSKKLKSEIKTLKDQFEVAEKSVVGLREELKKYEKYRMIINAEVAAKEIESKAKEEYERLINEAKQEKLRIEKSTETELESSRNTLANLDAKVNLLEKASRSLKNIVDGYGDKFIIPTYSLIDQLADDYTHTTAGESLKKTREIMRSMVNNKTAAACDYVENNRKEIASDFVLDAFNGKVDSILSNVKQDNYGTLSQKIKDAFVVVNLNGSAFRNARITNDYLDVRLTELKLACTVAALKEKEKEEQRRIKEQLREEEKAIKEYERALKEAQKEEESVAKTMEKVKKDMEAASEQKRLFYEEKLKELEVKLKEAEEKNKRAQSMAELTKSGHVYIISNIGSFGDEVFKIGMTRRLEPQDRVDELGDASVPFEFDVHAMIYSEDAPALEKALHRKFLDEQVNKLNSRKEFFRCNLTKIKNEVEQLGFKVHWTMTAEAREYRESLAIGKTKKAA